ncbi:hypothetical protein MKW94_028722, partial [Papaver nudicaule]|nr:hypothetical protein [Papaver nudicaule]
FIVARYPTKLCEAVTDIIKLGVTCSIESPKERMEMVPVVKELQAIKNKEILGEFVDVRSGLKD